MAGVTLDAGLAAVNRPFLPGLRRMTIHLWFNEKANLQQFW